jgi:hypothetical protein
MDREDEINVKKKTDRPYPHFELCGCRFKITANGPWYVGVVVNDGDMILTRNGKLLATTTLFDIKLADELLHIELGGILRQIEDIVGSYLREDFYRTDPPESFKTVKELKEA